jgi:hypothetical protein
MTSVVCPRCATELRLLREPTDQTPARCYACQAVFSLEPIATAPVAAPAAAAPPPPAPPPLRLEAPVLPPAAPGVAAAGLSSPPPPVRFLAATESTLPRAVAPPRAVFLGPNATALAAGVVVLLVAGAAAGLLAYRAGTERTDASGRPPEEAKAPDAPPVPLQPTVPKSLPSVLAPDLDRARELLGAWESRADDGSWAALEFRRDGTATFTPAHAIDQELTPLPGRWSLYKRDGNIIVVDLFYNATGLEVHRLTVEIGGPDALTVLRSVFHGRMQYAEQRFVRTAAPPPP